MERNTTVRSSRKTRPRAAIARAALAAGDVDRAEALFREAMAVHDAAGMRGARAAVTAIVESLAQRRT